MPTATYRELPDARLFDASATRGMPNDPTLAQFRMIVDTAPYGVVIGQDGLCQYANAWAAALMGLSPDWVQGARLIELVHPDDHELVRSIRDRQQASGVAPAPYRMRLLRSDGRALWVEVNTRRIHWANRAANLVFFSDVDTEHRLLEQLMGSEQKYRALVEHANDGVLVNQDDRVRYCNPKFLEIMGRDQTFFEAHVLNDTVYPPDLTMADLAYTARMRGEPVAPYELRVIRGDGALIHLRINGVAIHWDGGPASLIYVTDVTERISLQARLADALSEREAMLQSSAVGVCFVQGRAIKWVNEALARLLDSSSQQLLDQQTTDFFASAQDFDEQARSAYRQLAAKGSFSGEMRLQSRNRRPVWFQVDGRLVQSDAAQITENTRSVWTFVDITQRKQSELDTARALIRERELNDLKTRFISMASHEFRTPLATIMSSAELLEHYGEQFAATERAEILADIHKAVTNMSALLEDVLTLGKSESGQLRCEPQPLDLLAFAQKMARDAAATIGGQRQFELVHTDIPALLELDDRLLRHILSNLLSNAWKYSNDGGRVGMDLRVRNDRLTITVSDDGIGIPQGEQARLFESFYRARNAADRPGTGLGLSIVARATQAHGGTIAFQSVAGQGSTFTVHIPLS